MPEYFMKLITGLPIWGQWVFWIVTLLGWLCILFKVLRWLLEMTRTDPL
jgi:hypothetical protein